MLSFFAEYGLFIAKIFTVVIAVLILVAGLVAIGSRKKEASRGHIKVTKLNDKLSDMTKALKQTVLDKNYLKQEMKSEKQKAKSDKKDAASDKKNEMHDQKRKKRVYVINFDGDIKASANKSLREEVTTVLSLANEIDEIVIRLESTGGMVHAYGLASSQLQRIRDKNIPLTICVDKVAASGGYMMACIGSRILAGPFAMIGSIGVVAQLPNFHRLLQKKEIDFELLTAGEYKRTLTMFGENTDKAREKFQHELEDTHVLFKEFVSANRPQLDIDKVATGEVWFGQRALEKNLVDELKTSDEYIVDACQKSDVFEVVYEEKKSIQERLGATVHYTVDKLFLSWWERLYKTRFYS